MIIKTKLQIEKVNGHLPTPEAIDFLAFSPGTRLD